MDCGRVYASTLKPGDVVCLDGTLGSGKTTFAKGVALGLGIAEDVTSPTFSLINVYKAPIPLYHMDLYRLSSAEEFELIGGMEYLEGQGICLIEWSEIIRPWLPDQTRYIELVLQEKGRRIRFLNEHDHTAV